MYQISNKLKKKIKNVQPHDSATTDKAKLNVRSSVKLLLGGLVIYIKGIFVVST